MLEISSLKAVKIRTGAVKSRGFALEGLFLPAAERVSRVRREIRRMLGIS
jgi:hypothetical protein